MLTQATHHNIASNKLFLETLIVIYYVLNQKLKCHFNAGSLQVEAVEVRVGKELAHSGRGEDAIPQRQKQPALREDVPRGQGSMMSRAIYPSH